MYFVTKKYNFHKYSFNIPVYDKNLQYIALKYKILRFTSRLVWIAACNKMPKLL